MSRKGIHSKSRRRRKRPGANHERKLRRQHQKNKRSGVSGNKRK